MITVSILTIIIDDKLCLNDTYDVHRLYYLRFYFYEFNNESFIEVSVKKAS